MGRPFRLIDLPSIPLRMVFHRMDAPQLYFLAPLRRQLFDVIASLRKRTILAFEIKSWKCTITLQDGLQLHFVSDVLDIPQESFKDSLKSFIKDVRNNIADLKRVFPRLEISLKLHMDSFSFFESIVGENDFDRCSELTLEGGTCNTQKMDRLRRTLKRVEQVYFYGDMEANVESRKWLLNSFKMVIASLNSRRVVWFTAEELMNSTCSFFELSVSSLTEHDLNRFIRKWIDNNSPQFRGLNLYLTRGIRREEVMRDLGLRRYDPNRFPSHQTSKFYKDLSKKKDAYESNGRFVSFTFTSWVFQFKVWRDE